MYTSQYFREERPHVVREFLNANAFATLISHTPEGFAATQLPLLLDAGRGSQGALLGHMARGNPQWRCIPEGAEVLVTFLGSHSYVSPRAYTVEPDVPTWNYTAAHVRGTWRIERDQQRVFQHLEAAIARFENERGEPIWRLDSLTSQLIEGLYRGIVAFEIEITRIDCAFKLSQDKSGGDRRAVINDLGSLDDPAAQQIAQVMRRYYDY